jgi:AcrR family transcriptional regulator
MAETHTGLRERKNARTQATIVRAACELVLERGFDGATIALIAERADVAPRTVHTWFASKEDILTSGLMDPLDRLSAALDGTEGDVLQRIETWMREEAAISAAQDELQTLRYQALASDPHLRGVGLARLDETEEALARAFAEDAGAPPHALATRALAAAIIKLLTDLSDRALVAQAPADPDELVKSFVVLRAGLDALRAQYGS